MKLPMDMENWILETFYSWQLFWIWRPKAFPILKIENWVFSYIIQTII